MIQLKTPLQGSFFVWFVLFFCFGGVLKIYLWVFSQINSCVWFTRLHRYRDRCFMCMCLNALPSAARGQGGVGRATEMAAA